MKKVALSLIALAVVGVGAFADAPKWDPKISTEIKGDASVTLGYDLDTGISAFANATSVDFVVDLITAGDRSTSSDQDVWGEIKIKAGDDPYRLKVGGTAAYTVKVDFAKIHFGKAAYLSITDTGAKIKYASSPDLAFLSVKFDNADRYGKAQGNILTAFGDTGTGNGGGVQFGYSLEKIVDVTVAVGSLDAWSTALVNSGSKTNIGYKAAVDVTALADLGLTLGAGYSSSTKGVDADTAIGAKAGYKLALDGDKLYVKVSTGLGIVDRPTDAAKPYNTASAGLLLGTGGKGATFDNFGLKLDSDFGGYPGVAFGLFYNDMAVVDKVADAKAAMGVNVSANSGSLIPDWTIVAAYDIKDLSAKDLTTNLTAGLSTKLMAGDISIAPKAMVSMFSSKGGIAATGAMTAAADSSLFAKVNTEIGGVIPFTTFIVNYESNDLSNGYGTTRDGKLVSDKTGKVELTVKIAL